MIVAEDDVWFVERGCTDLFMGDSGVRADRNRHHVMSVGPGRVFLGLGTDGLGERKSLLAAGRQGVRLCRISLTHFDELLVSHRAGGRLRGLLDTWFSDLRAAVRRKGGSVDERLTASHPVDWDAVRTVAQDLWLGRLPSSAQFEPQARGSTVEQVFAHLVNVVTQPAPDGGGRPLGTRSPPGRLQRHSNAALFEACRLVAGAMGVELRPAGNTDSVGASALPSILRPSRMRSRKVALREDWWKSDHGPLLAFTSPEEEPVALLPAGKGYRAIFSDGEVHLVDDHVASQFAPFGHAFYASLPARELRIRDVMAFAAHGAGRDLVLIVVMSLLATLLGMLPAAATGMLFNSIIPGAQRSQLQQMAAILVVCGLAQTGLSLVQGFALLRLQQRAGTRLQGAVWDRLLRLPLTFSRGSTAGDLATRAMAIEGIQNILSGTALTTVLAGLFSLTNLVMMFVYSPRLALHALLLIAIAVAMALLSSFLDLRPQRALLDLQAKTSGLVLQLLNSIGKLRVAGAESRAFAQWAHLFGQQRRLQLRVRRIHNWFKAYSAAFPILAQMFLFWVALPLLGKQLGGGDDQLRTGDWLAFSAAFGSCFGALLSTAVALLGMLAVLPLYQQAKPILTTATEVHESAVHPGPLSGAIELRNVSFRYEASSPFVLSDVSLTIAPGTFVAVVGPSGSGKSTLLRLLLGFEKASNGGVYFDGQEIGGLDVHEVRRQLGVVLQGGMLMPGDVYSNIAAARQCTLDEAWTAAEKAGIADDIRMMPMQMHTVIGEGASTLSGGQRQRLMIARAIVNRPRILLLDEATSALDNRAQALVSASLEQIQATRIVVAHRLSTIVKADSIIVMDGGRIVETGTYVQLLAEGGVFAALARRQLV
ncbi:MAG TPA: NHLP bacteriocin export ABC transporter permease/ATPase subunit [Polyangia bacterium]